MKLTYLYFLFVVNSLYAYPDSLKAVQVMDQVLISIEQENIDSINHYIKKRLTIFKKHDDLYSWLYWNKKLGRKYRGIGQHEKAIVYFENALNKGWRKTKDKKELSLIAKINGDIGFTYYEELNALEPALEYYEKCKTLFIDSLDEPDIYIAEYIYNNLGNICSGLRDVSKAKYYLEQQMLISQKELDWDLYGGGLVNLASAYGTVENFSLAIKTLQKGLMWKDSLPVKYNISLLHDMGLYYYHLHDYKEARNYTNQAKALFNKYIESFSKWKQADYQYSFYYNYGRINRGEKNFNLAESYYQKALHLLQTDLKEGNRRQMAIMHFNFGELYLVQKQYDKAEKYFYEAIAYLSPLLSEYKDPHLVPANLLNGEFLLGYAYQKLGNIAVALYKQNKNTANLYKAIRYYELADLVDQLRIQNYTTEESILTALAEQKDLKEDMQFALYELYQHNPQDSIKEKMLAFSEKSRAFLLLKKDKLSKDVLGWDEESQKRFYLKQAKQKTLAEDIFALKENDLQDNSEQLNLLRGQWLDINEELADLQQQKNKDSKFKFSQPASLNTIRKMLDDDQGLVAFFVGEVYIYTYAISTEGLKVYRKPRTEALVLAIERLRNALVCDHDAIEVFGSNASYLFEVLLKESLEEFPNAVDRLVLVPDHLLNFIPFEVLLTSPYDNKMHYYNMPYLIRRYSISSANSATLYTLQQQKNKIRAERLFAGYAPRFHAGNIPEQDTCEMQLLSSLVREGYSELKGARKEVNKIATALDGDSIIGKNALKAHFVAEADSYRILLLSTHGFVNSENPHFSKLLFAPASSQNKADDVFTALELYNLNLNAELVVLSACNTGSGTLYPGEGVFSFSRAFFAAGVPSTVMTLWKVDDQSTSEVMVSFFEYLKKDMSKGKALQQAKLDYLKNNKNDKPGLHPYYWSGVLVSGNTNSLNLESKSFPRTYVLLFFLLLSIFALRFFSKKSN